MAHIDAKKKVIRGKIVYYGPGWCGKTTNLEYVNRAVPNTPEMMSLATEGDRTIFFDYLPMHLGKIRGISTSFKLYTVPGQVRYNQTRKMVLKNVDGVVFVADSQPLVLDANVESLQNLHENIEELGMDPRSMPIVMQYNKRDLPEVLPVEEMRAALNSFGYPEFEASATEGFGVLETLKGICSLVFKDLSAAFGDGPQKAARQKTITGVPRPGVTPAPKAKKPSKPPAKPAKAQPPPPPVKAAPKAPPAKPAASPAKEAMAKAAKTPAPKAAEVPLGKAATPGPASSLPATVVPRTPVPRTPVPTDSPQLAELAMEMRKLVAEMGKTRGSLDGVARELLSLKKLVAGMGTSVTSLESTVAELGSNVAVLESTVGGLEPAAAPASEDADGEVEPSMSALAQLSALALASEDADDDGDGAGAEGSYSRDPRHAEAARIARVMVEDLELYYGDDVAKGLKADDLETRLKEAMEDMRRTYNARVDRAVRSKKDYLEPTIEAFLAKKRESLSL